MYGWIAVNDGGVWRNITSGIQLNDNGTWRQITNVEVNDNGTWRPVFEVWQPNHSIITSGNPVYEIRRSGIAVNGGGANWYWGDDISSSIGDNYAVIISPISGVTPIMNNGVLNAWQDISNTRTLELPPGSGTSVSKWQIATDVAGNNIHAVWYITLTRT